MQDFSCTRGGSYHIRYELDFVISRHDHDIFIPYDAENNLIGQFMDLVALPNTNDDTIGRLEEDGKWEGSFTEKMYPSRSVLCMLRMKLSDFTDLARNKAASNDTTVPYNVASITPSNSSDGSSKRKR